MDDNKKKEEYEILRYLNNRLKDFQKEKDDDEGR